MRYLIVKTGDTELLRDSHLEGISDGEVFRSGVLLSRLLPRDNEVYWYGVPKNYEHFFHRGKTCALWTRSTRLKSRMRYFILKERKLPFRKNGRQRLGFLFRWSLLANRA